MSRKKNIRVAIVDDSSFMRKLMKNIIEEDPQFEIVGQASHGREIIEKFREWKPDVITLDIQMPVLSGLPTLHYLMKHHPVRVVVVSAFTTEEAQLTVQALELGAIDVLLKPQADFTKVLPQFSKQLREKLQLAMQVDLQHIGAYSHPIAVKKIKSALTTGEDVAIVIGGSTGGIVALESILPYFPENTGATIFSGVHLSDFFSTTVEQSLASLTFLPVKVLQDREKIKKDIIYLLRGGFHTSLLKNEGQIVAKVIKPPEDSHEYCPSLDLMMRSVAAIYGRNTLGILLTGMGDDGVDGLRAIKEAGGRTLAESAKTALINGMPEAARQAGVVDQSCPLFEIPEAMMNFLTQQGVKERKRAA